jgi:hypothetical protein
MPEDVKARVYQAGVKQLMMGRVDEALADRELSPEEEDDLRRLSESLGTNITDSADKARALNDAQLRWRILHDALP